MKHILITGGAGYIGSLLTSELLRLGYRVTTLDSLLFGGEAIVPFLHHPNFHFVKTDVTEPRAVKDALKDGWQKPDAVIHLAAIVGFPACQAVGKQVAWKYNVDSTKMVYEQATDLGVERFVFASTYSNYGLSQDGKPVTEESPLNPQSLYAETKIAAEEFLLSQKDSPTAPLLFRFATLYGLSPRTRFDLIVNQFVLEAFTKRVLVIYQRGYSRSFVHIRDVARGVIMGLEAEQSKIRGQIFNLGTDNGNYSKDDIVTLVRKRMPEVEVEYKDLTFGGDMRDITVSFAKIKSVLGFDTTLDVDDGIRELLFALKTGLIQNPTDTRYRNAQFIVQ
ncbi:MAG: NAD(P)-dependent oxidoreductase [Anaerolineae bacterium]|jgi:nucleoside-diphosphate-sugar epimerase|nr:NAD(P)-dependent oxidoreductase [Anaerolineae bacterium]MBL8104882.1 NAD(P)-dependent oxidoreductase [Anaerolineales bacterium]MCC7189843.1 NAD(P)-dependent oxidoreductase [Anaerolineales bacterium]